LIFRVGLYIKISNTKKAHIEAGTGFINIDLFVMIARHMLHLNLYQQKYPNNTTPVAKTRLPDKQPLKADTLSFKGPEEEKPPEIPDFLKERFNTPMKKDAGFIKCAVIMIGGTAVMAGTAALCTAFLPAAIAGIPILIVSLGITLWGLGQMVSMERVKKFPPLTPEQRKIAILYHADYGQYLKRQQWRQRKAAWNNFQNNVQTFIANLTKPFKSTQKLKARI
jgi:hypothetical protein